MQASTVVLLLAVFLIGADCRRFFPKRKGNAPTEQAFKTLKEEQDYRRAVVCVQPHIEDLHIAQGTECPSGHAKLALGRYRNDVNITGWGVLEVETYPHHPDQLQAFAAGVVEGYLTKVQIHYHFRNTVTNMCDNQRAFCDKLYRYVQENLDWIRDEIRTKPESDPYWHQVNLTFTQLTGVFEGYRKPLEANYTPSVSFIINPILMLQLPGEIIDLTHAFNRTYDPLVDDPEPSRCSGLVKVTSDLKDLMISHVSMSGYNTMNRIAKLYKFAYDTQQVPGHTAAFSGYPGCLTSFDDYNILSSGLATIETTFAIFNETLYGPEYVKAKGQLHCWVRSILANRLAHNGSEWTQIFARHNSGTYNNQWTVLDFKAFKPGQPVPDKDILWVLEQTPGYTESRDVSYFLKKYGYWPSYNIPYLYNISRRSGFFEKGNQNNWWRWGYSPRALIFRRDQNKIKTFDDLKKIMRYNDYTHDEYSKCNCNPPYSAEAAIATRGDLNPINGTYEVPGMGHRNHGSLDYKGTNYEHFWKYQIELIGGPTYDPLPPFNWNTTDIVAPHFGQPTLWKFSPFITNWEADVHINH